MWDAHELDDPQHANTFDNPELYSFVDISQNNHQLGEAHWHNMAQALARLDELPRPANNVKIYGAPNSAHSNAENGLESFWRNILGGCASARFHRPTSGWGLSETAQAHIHAARQVTDSVNIFECRRHNDLLHGRGENHAYCAARPGTEAVVFFTRAESLGLDTSDFDGPTWLCWMDPEQGLWTGEPERMDPADRLPLDPPFGPRSVALVKGA
jgi:hypothetical protein